MTSESYYKQASGQYHDISVYSMKISNEYFVGKFGITCWEFYYHEIIWNVIRKHQTTPVTASSNEQEAMIVKDGTNMESNMDRLSTNETSAFNDNILFTRLTTALSFERKLALK